MAPLACSSLPIRYLLFPLCQMHANLSCSSMHLNAKGGGCRPSG